MKKINYIKLAKQSAKKQISELRKISKVFNNSFIKAVETIYQCKGKVICAGVGKSGLIARKISATLSSVGISSFFLSPSEANHGDLGQIDKKDVLLEGNKEQSETIKDKWVFERDISSTNPNWRLVETDILDD